MQKVIILLTLLRIRDCAFETREYHDSAYALDKPEMLLSFLAVAKEVQRCCIQPLPVHLP
jgi:hypothetical protein